MEASEGKLFRPLAFTKSFALLASVIVAITIIPPLAELLFGIGKGKKKKNVFMHSVFGIVPFVYALVSNKSKSEKLPSYFSNIVLVGFSIFLLFTSQKV